MSAVTVFVLLVLASGVWQIVNANTECTCTATLTPEQVESAAYDLCVTSDLCSDRFFISLAPSPADARATFHYLLRILADRLRDQVDLFDMLGTTLCCTTAQDAWLHTMELADFCTDSEEFVAGQGCTCRSGRVCVSSPEEEQNIGTGVWIVLNVLVLAVFIYFGRAALLEVHHWAHKRGEPHSPSSHHENSTPIEPRGAYNAAPPSHPLATTAAPLAVGTAATLPITSAYFTAGGAAPTLRIHGASSGAGGAHHYG